MAHRIDMTNTPESQIPNFNPDSGMIALLHFDARFTIWAEAIFSQQFHQGLNW